MYPYMSGDARCQCVHGVDEGGDAAELLGLRDDMQRQRGLARRLRAVDLHDSPPWDPTHAERHVEGERSGWDHVDVALRGGLPQLHDGALPIAALDLAERSRQCPVFF